MEENIIKLQSLLKNNDSDGVISLLKEHPQLLGAKTEQGLSLLMLAAYYKNATVLDYFNRHKPDLTLFEAAAIGNLEVLKNIINDDPASVNSFSPDGFTPLGLASYFGQQEAVSLLIGSGANVNTYSNNGMKVAPLHSAVASKNIAIAHILLNNGADVNAKQTLGVTPLHSAAHQGHKEMVKLLLKFKADIHAQMENGKKPLDFANEDNNQEVAALLNE